MKSRLLRGVALMALMTSPAVAADLSFKAPQSAPVSGPVPNWTGFYVGLNAGGAFARSGDPSTTASCAGTYFGCADALAVSAAGTGSMSKAAFVGGGQAGYNWQVNAVVLGGEVDFDSFNVRLSRTGSGVLPTIGGTFTITSSASSDWLFTARGRIGWAFDNLLLYGTGGLAETQLNASNSYMDTAGYPPGPGTGAWNTSAIKLGWTAGGGVEWALNRNWSVKAEYLFVKFGSINAFGTVISTVNPTGYASAIGTSTDLTASIARAGVNYKF
jgi:outer membrane immunogenic protein